MHGENETYKSSLENRDIVNLENQNQLRAMFPDRILRRSKSINLIPLLHHISLFCTRGLTVSVSFHKIAQIFENHTKFHILLHTYMTVWHSFSYHVSYNLNSEIN